MAEGLTDRLDRIESQLESISSRVGSGAPGGVLRGAAGGVAGGAGGMMGAGLAGGLAGGVASRLGMFHDLHQESPDLRFAKASRQRVGLAESVARLGQETMTGQAALAEAIGVAGPDVEAAWGGLADRWGQRRDDLARSRKRWRGKIEVEQAVDALRREEAEPEEPEEAPHTARDIADSHSPVGTREEQIEAALKEGGFGGGIKALLAAGGLGGLGAATIGGMTLSSLGGAAAGAVAPLLAAGKMAQRSYAESISDASILNERVTTQFGEGAYLADPVAAAMARQQEFTGFAGRLGTPLRQEAGLEATIDQNIARRRALSGFSAAQGRAGAKFESAWNLASRAPSRVQEMLYDAWVRLFDTREQREAARAGRRASMFQEAFTGRSVERSPSQMAAEQVKREVPGIFGEITRGMAHAGIAAGMAGQTVRARSTRELPQEKKEREKLRSELTEIERLRQRAKSPELTFEESVYSAIPVGGDIEEAKAERLSARAIRREDELVQGLIQNQRPIPQATLIRWMNRKLQEMQQQMMRGQKAEAKATRKEIKHAMTIK